MCLIALAHRASQRFPLVVAANRDEDYARPTLPAAPWPEDSQVIGGRDVLHGGAWLAISASGRFAAVTNLRGAAAPPGGRSRGFLVRDFVLGAAAPQAYVAEIAAYADSYAGFHLLAGEVGREMLHFSRAATVLDPGVHGLSNAPAGERWPKVDAAVKRLRSSLERSSAEDLAAELLGFLATPPSTGDVEREVFLASERYGTRASSVIVATDAEIVFYEQAYSIGGRRDGEVRRLVLRREP